MPGNATTSDATSVRYPCNQSQFPLVSYCLKMMAGDVPYNVVDIIAGLCGVHPSSIPFSWIS